jgi:glutathione S-transferase
MCVLGLIRFGNKCVNREAPVALESAATYFATQLRHAEQALQDGRPFLVGGRLTTADILLTTCWPGR